MNAWIETSDGRRIPIESNCHFGRLPSNTVRLTSPGVSRRHAHIHVQHAEGRAEYWLVDLGSTNGTVLNGKRVTIPCRIKDGDSIRIAEDAFTFRVEFNPLGPSPEADVFATMPVCVHQHCWFLMVDIKRYTALARQLSTDVLAPKVGTWLRQTRDIIESAGGVVDKFLGDAFFAYWPHGDQSPATVAGVLRQLQALQQSRDPDFRIVLHRGRAAIFGGAGGADNVTGPDVIYVFRLEKVCSMLGNDSIVSAAAMAALPPDCPCEPVGSHPLDGFPGTHAMFKLASPSPAA